MRIKRTNVELEKCSSPSSLEQGTVFGEEETTGWGKISGWT